MRNTIISGDGSRPNFSADFGGTFISEGHNLSSDDGSGFLTGPDDLTNTNPLLGPLQDNGGPTQTMALLPGSPALNAGDPSQLGVPDQRGVVRSGSVNIGAYQASASAFVLTAPATVTAGAPYNVTVTTVDPFGQAAVGYLGTVTFSSTDTDPGVLLPADYTFTAKDGGVHTFAGGFTLVTMGDQTVTATDTADPTITGSATVTVAPSPVPGPRTPTVISKSTRDQSTQSGQHVVLLDHLFASMNGQEFGFIEARLKPYAAWDKLFQEADEALV